MEEHSCIEKFKAQIHLDPSQLVCVGIYNQINFKLKVNLKSKDWWLLAAMLDSLKCWKDLVTTSSYHVILNMIVLIIFLTISKGSVR